MVTLFDHDTQDKDAARDLASAIVNVHLATGRVGKPGAGFLSVAGGANGMGLREVGAFSTMLAAHRGFDTESRADVGRLWGAPSVAAGPDLEGDALWEAVLDGRIKALWIMEGDPAGDEIDTGPARAALAACPLVILSDCYADSETAGFAHIMLPTNDAAERNGTATGFDRLISRQRPVSPASGEARPGWWIVTQVAQRMGWHDAFYFRAAADVYREHARLSAYGNGGERQFDLRRHAAISNPAYDEMTPWRWGGAPFAEGRFATEDGRARLVSVD
jgi:assimilatory nitrate reductase catalytic subunit